MVSQLRTAWLTVQSIIGKEFSRMVVQFLNFVHIVFVNAHRKTNFSSIDMDMWLSLFLLFLDGWRDTPDLFNESNPRDQLSICSDCKVLQQVFIPTVKIKFVHRCYSIHFLTSYQICQNTDTDSNWSGKNFRAKRRTRGKITGRKGLSRGKDSSILTFQRPEQGRRNQTHSCTSNTNIVEENSVIQSWGCMLLDSFSWYASQIVSCYQTDEWCSSLDHEDSYYSIDALSDDYHHKQPHHPQTTSVLVFFSCFSAPLTPQVTAPIHPTFIPILIISIPSSTLLITFQISNW